MLNRRTVLGTIVGSAALSGCVGISDSHEENSDGLSLTNRYTTMSGGNQILVLNYELSLSEGEWASVEYPVEFDCWFYMDSQPNTGSIQIALGHEKDLYGYRSDGNLNPHFIRTGSDEIDSQDEVFAETWGTWEMIVDNTDYFDGFNPTGDLSGELEVIVEAINA